MDINDITDKIASDIFEMLSKKAGIKQPMIAMYGGTLYIDNFIVCPTIPVASRFNKIVFGDVNSSKWHEKNFLKAFLYECQRGNSFVIDEPFTTRSPLVLPFMNKGTTLESLLIELDLSKA